MARLEAPATPKATLGRRALLAAAPAGLLAACDRGLPQTVSSTPDLDVEGLGRAIEEIASRARPGVLGVGLMNLDSGQVFAFNGDRRFPMQSVFKLPLAAAALSEVEQGRLALSDTLSIDADQLSPGHSPITAAWPQRRVYRIEDLLRAALTEGDNTAADVLMKQIGGPGAVTAWLTDQGLRGVNIDRYERELAMETLGMASFRPAWRSPAVFAAELKAVSATDQRAAVQRYLTDPRDTATPRGMLAFLHRLDRRELLPPDATRTLLSLMSQTRRGSERIRAGLPRNTFLAHRPGSSGAVQGICAAHNDVGLFVLPDRRTYALALFLSGARADAAVRDRILADATRAVVRAVG
jgi:beta-lactamase class A